MHWLGISLEVSTHLPRAESLEEEEERKAPDHGGADDAEQGDKLDSLSTAELGKHAAVSKATHCPPSYWAPPRFTGLNHRTQPSLMPAPCVLTHYPP